MTKQELQNRINQAVKELQTAIEDAKAAAIKYGEGTENMAFEVGFLNSRIKGALGCLEDVSTLPKR